MPFTFQPLAIPEIVLIEPKVFTDDRGFFLETFRQSAFAEAGMTETFVQMNHSHSTAGVLRGLHYQKHPAAQAKLVMALAGEIFDVAVDLRRGSPNYGKWVGAQLTADNHRLLYIPPGFAHGFCVLSAEADIVYLVSQDYAPAYDRGVRWNDPDIGIAWPLSSPQLSPKDASQPRLRDADHNFVYEG